MFDFEDSRFIGVQVLDSTIKHNYERSTHIFLWITALINKTNIVFVHNVMIIIIHTGPDGDDNPRVDPFSTLQHSYVNIISNPHYAGDPGAVRGQEGAPLSL